MSDHEPVQVHVVKDSTTPTPVNAEIVGMARNIGIRVVGFADGPQPVLAHNPKRRRALISPLYGNALGLIWVCDSESNAQASPPIGYPLVSGIPGGAGTAVVDFLESFATTELWAVADPANANNVTLRIWTETKS
jgi:hypothetical protein